ncbi:T9SS type A sorting domain-containing protein [Portibacter marinus]|uniref:T9SS type A sorting domain-containing protein n=1 Tax=Portibacter marinus TaxID=2898660 RepID=UPI001F3CFD1F|nr:T9SS type A sorting domain-containing protein [Portibacter marinus]
MKADLQIKIPQYLLLILTTFILSFGSVLANEINDCEDEDVVFEIYCPPTKWIDCDDEIWDLSWLGNAWYKDYTGTHDAGEPQVKYHLNDCNVGYITRTWKVADYHGYWHKCTQKIYVQGNYFNSGSIKWPKNIELSGCNPPTDPEHLPYGKNKPTWSTYGATCSKIGVNYHDNVFTYGPGCYEIIRTWKIVDCCNFNPWTNTGIWTYNQRITVTTAYDAPQVWVPYDVTAETTGCQKAWVDIPPLQVKDGCEDQYIITNNSPFAYKNGADASGKYPVGTTKVRFMVKYNCWETKFFYVNVTVKDNSTPVPYCYFGLAVPLMGVDEDGDGEFEDGMREVWASEFDAGSYFPCNPHIPLKFSFSSDPTDNVRVFTCEEVGQQEVNIWVTAATGQQDYCTTYIKIQNNGADIPNCEALEEASISGKISSVYGNTESLMLDVNSSWEGMEFDTSYSTQTEVLVIDSMINEDGSISYDYGIAEVEVASIDTTDIDKDFAIEVQEGEFMLENLDLNEDYILTLSNMKPDYSFIDTMDVHVLSAFLEGKVELDMYQKMAADLNHDQIIDFDDLAILNDYVNGSNTATQFNWVTYDPDHQVPSNMALDVDDYPTSKLVEINNRNAVGVELMIFQMGDLTHASSLEDILLTQPVSQREIHGFELQSISPNPFSREVAFEFTNDIEQEVSLEIFTLNGAKVYSRIQTVEKGSKNFVVNANDMGTSGLYLYVLKSNTASYQGKLIQIK